MVEQKPYLVKLAEVIDEARKDIYLPDYRNKISDAEVLGALVSKLSKWELYTIKDVVLSALEDANMDADDLKEIL